MSSSVMTKIAAAVCDRDCSWRETEVTSTFMRSSIFIWVRSAGEVWGCASEARERERKREPENRPRGEAQNENSFASIPTPPPGSTGERVQ